MRQFNKTVASASASIFLFLALPAASEAAEFEIKPRVSVSEEYNDNIHETVTNKKEDFITRVMPGFSLLYKAPRLDAKTDYTFDYGHYARREKTDEYNHTLSANATLAVVENFFFIDASDTYRRVSLDAARDTTNETLYNNYSDQNIGAVSPYFIWRPGTGSTIKTGYRYTNTWYKESSGVDKQENSAFLEASHELLPKFSFTWGYSFTDTITTVQDYRRHNAYGGFRYEYADKSFLFGQAGNTWLSYDKGPDVSNIFWNAGLTHDTGTATITLETRVQYTEDPLTTSQQETLYSARVLQRLDRGELTASAAYSEFEIVETGKIDTRKYTYTGAGKYEILERFTASASLSAERYISGTIDGYPYRMSGTAGVSYSFNNDLSLALSYNHINYRYSWDNSSDSKNINRAVVTLSKVF